MTTAADIIKQYGRALTYGTFPGESGYLDFEGNMQTLALIVSDYGNNPLPYDEAEITRDHLGICLAGQGHWSWNCDQHNCQEANQ